MVSAVKEKKKKRGLVVLLDLDGTLHDSHGFWIAASRNAIKAMVENGFSVDEEKAFKRLKGIYSKNPYSNRHYNDLLRSFGFPEDPKIISAGIRAFHRTKEKKLRPYRDVAWFLEFLKKKQIPARIVTDGLPVKQWDKLHRLGLSRFFNKGDVFCTGARTTASEEIPREKNVVFYRRVFAALGVNPSNAIVVGDREESDVAPPKSLGATTVKVLRGKYAGEKTAADHAVNSFKQVSRIIKKEAVKRAGIEWGKKLKELEKSLRLGG